MEEGNNRAAYGQILIQEASACRISIQLAMHIKTSWLAYRRLPLQKLVCQLKAPINATFPRKRTAKRHVQAASNFTQTFGTSQGRDSLKSR